MQTPPFVSGCETLKATSPSSVPPSNPPTLQRQNAICLCCESTDTAFHPCSEIPPLSIREPQPSALSSPFVSPSTTLIDIVSDMETTVKSNLDKLSKLYEELQHYITQVQGDPTLNFSEMAAYDSWWDQLDRKRSALANFRIFLQNN